MTERCCRKDGQKCICEKCGISFEAEDNGHGSWGVYVGDCKQCDEMWLPCCPDLPEQEKVYKKTHSTGMKR